MTADGSNPKRRRWRWLVIAVLVVLAIAAGLAVFTTTAPFHRWVRSRVAETLHTATGGRVEMGGFQFSLPQLQFTISNLTIHGQESPGEAPFVHVDRVFVDAKIVSLFSRKIGLSAIRLDRPVIHVIVYADGRTNQGPPERAQLGSGSPIQRLFDLQVNRAEVNQGVLLVNDRALPLDFRADDLRAGLNYVAATRSMPAHYSGEVQTGRIETRYGRFQPFAATASAAVNLFPDRAQLTSFQWSSGQSTLQASGSVVNFAQPEVALDYRGQIDLAQFGAIAGVPEARRGIATLAGTLQYAGANYNASGRMQVRDVQWSQPELRVSGVSGGADYRLDKSNLALNHIFASVLGGTVSGDATVRDWAGANETGVVKLSAHGLSLAGIARATSTPAFSLERIGVAGQATGSINANWKGRAAEARATVALNLTPPARVTPGQLPVAGRVEATYAPASHEANVQALDVTAQSLHVTASGNLGPRNSRLNFAVTASRLHDFDPVLQALRLHSAFPAGMTAAASFNGELTGTLNAPVLTGRLQANGIVLPLPEGKEQRFDSLTALVRYTPSQVELSNAVLRRGPERARFDVTAGLVGGQIADNSPITAQLSAANFQISDLLALLGRKEPVTGTLDASARIQGTRAQLNGRGSVRISNATAWGEPIRSATADLQVAGQEVQANDIVIEHNGARVVGSAAYNLQNTGFRFDLRGNDFNLADLKQLQTDRFHSAGQMSFSVQGSGTRAQPSIIGQLEVRNWVLNGEPAGTLDLRATTSGDTMHLAGTSGFRTAALTLDGTIRLREDYAANLTLRFSHLDFDPLLTAYTKAKLTGHSSADGSFTLSGPLKQPDLLTLTGRIPQFTAEVQGVHLTNDGPIAFSVAHQTLRLEQFRLIGTDTHLDAKGSIALQHGGALDLQGEGGINLALLQSFNPKLHSAGQAAFQLQVRGTMIRPVLLGQVTITKGEVAYIDFPNGLSNINGTLLFNQDRMQVQKLTAETGGGDITFGGFVSYGETLGFNVSAKGDGIRLRYPTGVSTTANADLTLTGTARNLLLGGTLTVTRFSTTPQFDLATALAKARLSPQVPNPNSPLADLHFDVHIVSTPELQVQMSAAKLSGNADVHLRGSANRPVILGRVDITEGQVTFNGTRYTIERGDVTFTNPVRIEPVLDVEVTTRVRDYDVALGFHGPLDRLSTTYRSDPPLPTTDIIALLAFGKTREESAIVSEANPSFTESASNAILGQALTSASSSRVQKLFGVSRIKISPELEGTSSDSNNPNAQVTIEQQVSKNITVTYITDLSRSAQQVIQMEYAINRNFSIIALRDQNGVLSFDFRYRQRKR